MWPVEGFHVQEQTEVPPWGGTLNDPKVLELISLNLCMLPETRLTQPSNISPFFWLICPRLCGERQQPLIHSMPQTLRGSVCMPRPTTLLASNLIWKHFSSLSSSSPASSSSSSHSTSSSFLLFTTSTHAQLLSTLVLSEGVLFVRVYVPFYYISTYFWQVFCLEGWGLHVAPVPQPGSCHRQTRCCHITAFWQEPMNQIW